MRSGTARGTPRRAYAATRHLVYSGLLATTLGSTLLSAGGSAWAALVAVAAVVAFTAREEGLLPPATFGGRRDDPQSPAPPTGVRPRPPHPAYDPTAPGLMAAAPYTPRRGDGDAHSVHGADGAEG